jgi:stage III sporulation protein AD
MNDMGKIAAMAVVAALCAVVVKKQVPEVAVVLALAAGAVILCSCVQALREIMDYISELAELGGLSSSVVSPVIKVSGIAVVTRLTAEICRDVNEGGLAGFVEMAGTVMMLLTAVPLMTAVLSTVTELL